LSFKEQALSSDGEIRSRLQERVEEADLTLTLQKAAGKTPEWAEANIERAEALVALASEEEGADAFSCYDLAIQAYEQALKVYTKEDYLGEWGGVIVSLVRALRAYAVREGGQMGLLRLDRGEKLLEHVVMAMPEGRGQFDRAMLMIEQAHLHRIRCEIDRLSKREHHLRTAVTCFEQAAQILRLKENFDNWATAIIGQAMAWRDLAAVDGLQMQNSVALLRSIELFKAASCYYSPRRNLEDWVFCHFEQGRTLLRLAKAVDGEACRKAAEEAIVCFKTALEHITQEHTPELWMRCHIDMAFALITVEPFTKADDLPALMEEEIAIFRMAVDYYEAQGNRVTVSMMASHLGQKLLQFADIKQGRQAEALRDQALSALRYSVSDKLQDLAPDDWLSHVVDLGIALHNVATHQEGKRRLELGEEAIGVYYRALQQIQARRNLKAHALLYHRLGRLLATLNEDEEDAEGLSRLDEALACFRHASSYYDTIMSAQEAKDPATQPGSQDMIDLIRFKSHFSALLHALAQRLEDVQARAYLDEAMSLISQAVVLVAPQKILTSEWYDCYALYGRIVKQRLHRDFISNRGAACEEAAVTLRQAIAQIDKIQSEQAGDGSLDEKQAHSNELSRLILCRHLADIVYLWGRTLPKIAARPLFDEAHDLLSQLHHWAMKSGLEDMIRSSREELLAIETVQDSCRHGWIFRRLWRGLRSLNIRWS